MPPTHPPSLQPSKSFSCSHGTRPNLLDLPQLIIIQVLRFLLIQPHSRRLILPLRHTSTHTPNSRTCQILSILLICRQIHHLSIPVLYAENTFTSSYASASQSFDLALARLCQRNRDLISSIYLEFDHSQQLWIRLPLVARALEDLNGLRRLEIKIVPEGSATKNDDDFDGDGAKSQPIQRLDPIERRRLMSRWEREEPTASTLLSTEKAIIKELVAGSRRLQWFRLVGFGDEEFARNLSNWVSRGRKFA